MVRVVNTKRNTATEPEVVTSIRLTRDQHAALKSYAASQHRSMSQQFRVWIDQAIADIDAADTDREAA